MKHGGAGWSGTSAITCFLSEAYRERRLASSSHTEATANALHKRFVSSSFPMYFPYVFSLCKAHTHTHLLSHILSLVPRCSLSTRCQVSSTCSRSTSTLRPLAQHRVDHATLRALCPATICFPSAHGGASYASSTSAGAQGGALSSPLPNYGALLLPASPSMPCGGSAVVASSFI